jgi:hypothetical protein
MIEKHSATHIRNAFPAPRKYKTVAFLMEDGGEDAIDFDLAPNPDFDDMFCTEWASCRRKRGHSLGMGLA